MKQFYPSNDRHDQSLLRGMAQRDTTKSNMPVRLRLDKMVLQMREGLIPQLPLLLLICRHYCRTGSAFDCATNFDK